MPKTLSPFSLELAGQHQLSEYVTAIAWTPDGSRLVAISANGELVVYDVQLAQHVWKDCGLGEVVTYLQTAQLTSLDGLSISANGRFLATGGQAGTITLWHRADTAANYQLLTQLEYPGVWIDRLQWHPSAPELAFSLGRNVQIWNADRSEIVTTLSFEASSVLDLAWHPQGYALAVGGNQSVKIWQREDWEAAPVVQTTGGASTAIAWSPDGQYLASGNNDRSLLVWQWGNPHPWRMQGFPGKVWQLAWSARGTPRLASVSGTGIVTWTQATDPTRGWEAQVLDRHRAPVTAIAFQPQSRLLASAAEDGWVCLWQASQRLVQILQGAPQGFTSLAWNQQGTALAAGGQQGEILVWRLSKRGRGFR
ncbi:WD40 repeat domain-containing protein [Trichothermofontia sp.]